MALLAVVGLLLAVVLVLMPGRTGAPGAAGGAPQEAPEGTGTGGQALPALPEPPAGGGQRLPAAGKPERPRRELRLAVVIDDLGYNLEEIEPFLAVSAPLAFAVLPNSPYSVEAARRVAEAGREVLLHSPMEPRNGEDPGPGALLTRYGAGEIKALLDEQFRAVPGAEGMNNHMGSKATTDEELMDTVMAYLSDSGRFFLDSRTAADSVAGPAAARHNVAFLKRDVFLDNERSEEYMRGAFQAGLELAERNGQAVLIGHVHSPTLAPLLARLVEGLAARGARIVPLRELAAGGQP